MAKKEIGESKAESRKEMAEDKKQDVALIKKAFKQHDKQEHKGGKGTTLKLAKGGDAKNASMTYMTYGKTGKPEGLKTIKLAKGGVTGQAMRAVGRNLARAHNQKAGSK